MPPRRRRYGGGGRTAHRSASISSSIATVESRSPRKSSGRREAGSPTKAARRMVIFNMVPARDLDAPRATSDFEAYVPLA